MRFFLQTGFLALISLSSIAHADGLIVVESGERVPSHFTFAPLEVRYHHVNVQVDDDVAVTEVDQEFFNPASVATEGTYIFPLPANAHIDKFSIDMNGKAMDAELLDADKARSTYEDIVRRMKDPALLEYVGRGAFKARIYPIEAHGTKHVQIRYTELLKTDAGVAEYSYPLNTEKFSSRPIGNVSIDVKLRSSDPLKTITCPTHEARIDRTGDHDSTISAKWTNARPDTDFKVLFSRDRHDIGLQLMTYRRDSGSDGYYMLLASPGFAIPEDRNAKSSGKDIVFVLDSSGSMQGRKIEQARKALLYCLGNLRPQDRFDIVRFSTEAESIFPALVSADDQKKIAVANDWVRSIRATGGTAIDDALATALKLQSARDADQSSRPFMLFFLTDGQPTVGIVNEDDIVKRAVDRASNCRVFSFGLGNDVNTHLLDRLSDATRAVSAYVAESEDLEVKLASFYDKVNEPVATDVQLEFDGIQTTQQYPSAMPDLFKGQTIQVFGRYNGAGPAKLKFTAIVNGERREFAREVAFAERDTSSTFIPVLWATRRVGWLLIEMRQHGESQELKEEVVKLAREHGIVTPYTAYLISEDEKRRDVPLSYRGFQGVQQNAADYARLKDSFDSTQREANSQLARAGGQAVANSVAVNGLKGAENLGAGYQMAGVQLDSPASQPSRAGYLAGNDFSHAVRNIGDRAFYQNGNRWTDVAAQSLKADHKRQSIRFASDDYFKLLADHAEAAPWLSLGVEVDVLIGDTLYEIRES